MKKTSKSSLTPFLTASLSTALVATTMATASACKVRSQAPAASVKGVVGTNIDAAAQAINYDLLLEQAQKRGYLDVRFYFAYEEEHQTSAQRGENEAVTAVKDVAQWLQAAGFKPVDPAVVGPIDPSVERQVFEADAKFSGVKMRVELALGRSMMPQPPYLIPVQSARYLAQAMAGADVFAYNGHIWEFAQPDAIGLTVEPGENTAELQGMIAEALKGQPRGYGLMLMNACFTEKVEEQILEALQPRAQGAPAQPDDMLLLTQRHMSNYDFFGRQLTNMLGDLIQGRTTKRVAYDLMTTLEEKAAVADLANGVLDQRRGLFGGNAVMQPQAGSAYANGVAELPADATDAMIDQAVEAYATRYATNQAAVLVTVRTRMGMASDAQQREAQTQSEAQVQPLQP
jgi:hypothetical protein